MFEPQTNYLQLSRELDVEMAFLIDERAIASNVYNLRDYLTCKL